MQDAKGEQDGGAADLPEQQRDRTLKDPSSFPGEREQPAAPDHTLRDDCTLTDQVFTDQGTLVDSTQAATPPPSSIPIQREQEPRDLSSAPTMAAQPTDAPTGEATFTKRYRSTSEIGRGGMGRVLLAIDEQFGREVAIKELLPALIGHDSESVVRDFTDRFLREARVTGRLEHPGIIPVYEIGEREAQEEFELLVDQRKEKLAATQARAQAHGIEDVLSRVAKLSRELRFAHLDNDPFSTQPAIARNVALTQHKREETLAAVQQALSWAQTQRARLALAREAVAGRHVEFLSAQEIADAEDAMHRAEDAAIELALLSEHHSAARTALVQLDLSAQKREALNARITQAANSLVDAWCSMVDAAVQDMQKGRARDGREPEFRETWGMAALTPGEWVKRLIGFRDQRVAEPLAAHLERYTERARRSGAGARWSERERDALHVILETLGDLQQPQVAVPALGDFLRVANDAFYANTEYGTRASVVVMAGLALCATEHASADTVLAEVLQGRLINTPKASQIARRMSRLPKGLAKTPLATPESLNARAMAAHMRGDLEGAIRYFTQAIELDPTYTAAWLNRGLTKHQGGDIQGALKDYNQAIELNPDVPMSWVNRGSVRYVMEDYEGAIEDFNRAIQLNPNSVQYWINRAGLRNQLGDPEGAARDYDRAIQTDPNHVKAWHGRGKIRFWQGEYLAAIEDYTQAITLDPRYLAAWCDRAEARLDHGDSVGALEDIKQAFSLDPDAAPAWLALGRVRASEKQYEQALEHYTKALKLDPAYSDAWLFRAELYWQALNQPEAAVADLTQVISLDDQKAGGWMELAKIRLQQRDAPSALRHLSRAEEVCPASWPALPEVYQLREQALELLKEFDGYPVMEIFEVPEGYQGAKIGLRPFDVVHAINGKPIGSFEPTMGLEHFGGIMQMLDPNKSHTITVRRYPRDETLGEIRFEAIQSEDGQPRWQYEEVVFRFSGGESIGIWIGEQFLIPAE